jgi:hypothetical protein
MQVHIDLTVSRFEALICEGILYVPIGVGCIEVII